MKTLPEDLTIVKSWMNLVLKWKFSKRQRCPLRVIPWCPVTPLRLWLLDFEGVMFGAVRVMLLKVEWMELQKIPESEFSMVMFFRKQLRVFEILMAL